MVELRCPYVSDVQQRVVDQADDDTSDLQCCNSRWPQAGGCCNRRLGSRIAAR